MKCIQVGNEAVTAQYGDEFVATTPRQRESVNIRDKELVFVGYGIQDKIEGSHFEDYLDKIVQVKVPVPAREPDDMAEYIGSLVEEGRVFPQADVADVVPLIAEAGRRNPRSIIRLLNRIMVTVRIGQLEEKEYDPLALLLDIATDEPRYSRFRGIVTWRLRGKDASG